MILNVQPRYKQHSNIFGNFNSFNEANGFIAFAFFIHGNVCLFLWGLFSLVDEMLIESFCCCCFWHSNACKLVSGSNGIAITHKSP